MTLITFCAVGKMVEEGHSDKLMQTVEDLKLVEVVLEDSNCIVSDNSGL